MDKDVSKRLKSMYSQSMKNTGENHSLYYQQSEPIKREMNSSPRGYVPGEHMHHTAIVDVYEPIFRNTDTAEAALLADYAASLGVPVGNDPRNFVSMSEKDHLSGMHGYAGEIRLQLNNARKEMSAEERAHVDQFLNKIANAPFEAKKEALKIMIEYGQPIMDDRLRDLGYEFKSRKELANEYANDMQKERAQAQADAAVDKIRKEIESKEHLSESGKALRGQALSEARLDDLLKNIREDDTIPTRKATDKIMDSQAMTNYFNEAGGDLQSTGSIVGQKPFIINADEGANVYVHTDANGEAKDHAIMQEKFNRRRR